jgi:hypothetical protein
MSLDIQSWIAKAIVNHDRLHGANFEPPWTGAMFAQAIKVDLHYFLGKVSANHQFDTFRDACNPRRQITGIISDRTHCVHVEYDVDETDRYEE